MKRILLFVILQFSFFISVFAQERFFSILDKLAGSDVLIANEINNDTTGYFQQMLKKNNFKLEKFGKKYTKAFYFNNYKEFSIYLVFVPSEEYSELSDIIILAQKWIRYVSHQVSIANI